MEQNHNSAWGRRRRRRRRRYFMRHPITGLNFHKIISKPYYNQALLKNLNNQNTISNKIF
jgi:hypothetical protein